MVVLYRLDLRQTSVGVWRERSKHWNSRAVLKLSVASAEMYSMPVD